MFQSRRNQCVSIFGTLVLVFGSVACSQNHQADSQGAASQTADSQNANSPAPNSQAKDSQEKPGLLEGLIHPQKPVTLPENTRITVSLDQTLSSATSKPGEEFEATVLAPVMVNGKTVIPEGARAGGDVVDARPSGRLHTVPLLELELRWVEVNSKRYDIETGQKIEAGKNHKKRNLVLIGGGSGLGALIGGLAGGGKGALIGAGVGAGAGTAGAYATGKRDIRLPAETHLTFRLARPVTISLKS